MSEDDYRASESGGTISFEVIKDSRIASPITVSVSPLTVGGAIASGGPVPVFIPDDDPLSPSRASESFFSSVTVLLQCNCVILDLQDFSDAVFNITFEPDEDSDINNKLVSVSITNDDINEAIEQFFVIQMALVSSVNPSSVELSRAASLGRIVDDDRKLYSICSQLL